MKKLTGALIGCGAIAREHLAAVRELENVEMIAVCDLSEARAESTAERYGIPHWYTRHDLMLREHQPNLVHITAPPATHVPLSLYCLSAGLNVLCEKPVTTRRDDFGALKTLAEQKRCYLLENQNLRYHSSIRRIQDLSTSGALGDLLDVQIFFSLNLVGRASPYIDRNVLHFGVTLPGGVIGDFLTHIAYLAYVFAGPATDVRTIWSKRAKDTPLPWDEFRGFIKGERAPAYVGFSGNSELNGYWVKITGTRGVVETNLLEPPRLTLRRWRKGEAALASLADGISEARDVFRSTVSAFSRKLGGVSSYDGLPEMIGETYRALAANESQPISLTEMENTIELVSRLASSESML
jgi:predicted dehydrogenase